MTDRCGFLYEVVALDTDPQPVPVPATPPTVGDEAAFCCQCDQYEFEATWNCGTQVWDVVTVSVTEGVNCNGPYGLQLNQWINSNDANIYCVYTLTTTVPAGDPAPDPGDPGLNPDPNSICCDSGCTLWTFRSDFDCATDTWSRYTHVLDNPCGCGFNPGNLETWVNGVGVPMAECEQVYEVVLPISAPRPQPDPVDPGTGNPPDIDPVQSHRNCCDCNQFEYTADWDCYLDQWSVVNDQPVIVRCITLDTNWPNDPECTDNTRTMVANFGEPVPIAGQPANPPPSDCCDCDIYEFVATWDCPTQSWDVPVPTPTQGECVTPDPDWDDAPSCPETTRTMTVPTGDPPPDPGQPVAPGDWCCCRYYQFNADWNCAIDDWDITHINPGAPIVECEPDSSYDWTQPVECLDNQKLMLTTNDVGAPGAVDIGNPGTPPSDCCQCDQYDFVATWVCSTQSWDVPTPSPTTEVACSSDEDWNVNPQCTTENRTMYVPTGDPAPDAGEPVTPIDQASCCCQQWESDYDCGSSSWSSPAKVTPDNIVDCNTITSDTWEPDGSDNCKMLIWKGVGLTPAAPTDPEPSGCCAEEYSYGDVTCEWYFDCMDFWGSPQCYCIDAGHPGEQDWIQDQYESNISYVVGNDSNYQTGDCYYSRQYYVRYGGGQNCDNTSWYIPDEVYDNDPTFGFEQDCQNCYRLYSYWAQFICDGQYWCVDVADPGYTLTDNYTDDGWQLTLCSNQYYCAQRFITVNYGEPEPDPMPINLDTSGDCDSTPPSYSCRPNV